MAVVTETVSNTVGKTTVTVELSNGGWALKSIDTIEAEGGFWLVPHWTVSEDQSTRRPIRIISMTMVESGAPATDTEAFSGLPIPESLLYEGHVPLSLARLFLVRESPDLWWPNDDGR